MGQTNTGTSSMNIRKLQQLVQEGESLQVEFKKSIAQIKAAFTTVCAFLNGSGGIVVFGAKDNGELIGQHVADKTKLEIACEIKKIEPNAQISVHYIPIGHKLQVIALEVPPGKHIPYVYEARPYERTESSTAFMTQHRYEQLIIKRGQLNHSWEKHSARNYGIDDLDHDEIRNMVKDGIDQNRISVEVFNYDIDRILNKLELIEDGMLNNAAVVLFAKDIPHEFSQCTIKLARFRGKDKLDDFIDNQRVSGNAFQIIKAADAFTARHLPIASHFEPGQLKRIDQPAVPALALREALINAICHRDYTVYSSTISLAIYDDRLELWNVGQLPPHLKIEDLRTSHDSYPRNEKIAMTFYKRGWIESWGTGTTRMINYCKNNGTPEPVFVEYSGGFSVVFSFKEPMHTAITKEAFISYDELTSRQKEIINILSSSEEMSLKEVMQRLHNPPAERTVREDITILKKLKFIDSRGLSRATKWFVVK